MGLFAELKAHGFSPKKSLGQNFIANEGYLDSVVSSLGLAGTDTVIEVGTGAGTLTRVLASYVGQVITYEVDRTLEPILAKQFKGYSNIQVRFEDALKAEITVPGYKVVANLPYYITTPLLLKFLRDDRCIELTVLVQKELAERIVAPPGGKDYGALSVTVSAHANAKIIKAAPRNLFWPVPGVDSAFVRIIKQRGKYTVDAKIFDDLVKGLFSLRRKTLLNGLCQLFKFDKQECERLITSLGINPASRPEQLTITQFIALSNSLI